MGIPICGACRRPIEERVVTALGKHWHVEHFVCAKCEKPFLGHRHYEKKGLAYCETHYHQLFGNLCFVCNQVISGDGMYLIYDRYKYHKLIYKLRTIHKNCLVNNFLINNEWGKRSMTFSFFRVKVIWRSFGSDCKEKDLSFLLQFLSFFLVFTALNKAWCVHHFACAFCDQKMNQKTKFFEFDLKPACKKCYDKFPQELKKRMRRMYDLNPKRIPSA